MAKFPDNKNASPSSYNRNYLAGALLFLVLAAAIGFIVTRHAARRTYTPPYVNDTRTFRALSHSLSEFAYEHEGNLPAHISELITTYPDDWTHDAFISAYDRDQFISFAVNNPSPDCWYQYGSYWFYPISDLPHVDERSKLILMYREPRKKHDQYVVGFFDGIAVQMSEKEFHEAMEKHEQMTVSAN